MLKFGCFGGCRLRHTGPYLLNAMPMSQEASNYDEVSMQQSLLFSDSLKVRDLVFSSQACKSRIFLKVEILMSWSKFSCSRLYALAF